MCRINWGVIMSGPPHDPIPGRPGQIVFPQPLSRDGQPPSTGGNCDCTANGSVADLNPSLEAGEWRDGRSHNSRFEFFGSHSFTD